MLDKLFDNISECTGPYLDLRFWWQSSGPEPRLPAKRTWPELDPNLGLGLRSYKNPCSAWLVNPKPESLTPSAPLHQIEIRYLTTIVFKCYGWKHSDEQGFSIFKSCVVIEKKCLNCFLLRYKSEHESCTCLFMETKYVGVFRFWNLFWE